MSDTPLVDAISFTFRDLHTRARDLDALASDLERVARQVAEALSDCVRLVPDELGSWEHKQAARRILSAWREFEEKYK